MIKRESKATLLFRHYLKANPMDSAAFELKQTITDSIPFSDVQEHQITALLAVKSSKGLLYKAPDDSRGIKPFDLFYLRGEGAYVVIKFPEFFAIIDVDIFIKEKNRSKRKSLLSKRAEEISEKIVRC